MTLQFTRHSIFWIAFGGLLLVSSGVLFAVSRASQAREQEKRDQHWLKVMNQAAQTFPRMLPGEEKPAPAPLPNLGSIVALATVASTAIAAGIVRLLAALLSRSAIPGGTAAATPEPESPAR